MEQAIFARHGESVLGARSSVNGDPALEENALTEAGREQARALGMLLVDDPIDLCVTSEFARARETADIALAGRGVPRLVLGGLNDIRFGSFEGGTLAGYRTWAHAHGPVDDCPGGGESRVDAAGRYAAAFRTLLDRPERTLLVVAHALPIRYLLSALIERDPSAVVEPVALAEPHRVSAAQLERAAARLERWCERPAFA
ncbi:MAG: histidine phosphatase family protein [Gaiellaceae bacterium]